MNTPGYIWQAIYDARYGFMWLIIILGLAYVVLRRIK
jgi:hypothetical protein